MFVCTSVCLFFSFNIESRKLLHYNGQKKYKLEEDNDLSPYNVLLEKVKKKQQQTLPCEHTRPHPAFSNGKVLQQ